MEKNNKFLKPISLCLTFIGVTIIFIAALYLVGGPDEKDNLLPALDEISMTVKDFNTAAGDWDSTDTPDGDFLIKITDLGTDVHLEIRNENTVHAIYAYGHKAEINFTISYQTGIYNYSKAVIIANGVNHIADTYILTEDGVDELHKGDDYTYTLSENEDKLRYTKVYNKYAGAEQYVTMGVNAATGWDDIYYQTGDAEIKNGKIVFGDADKTVFAKDYFQFEKAFEIDRIQCAYDNVKYYETIEDLFEANRVYEIKNYKSVAKAVSSEEKDAVINAVKASVDYIDNRYKVSVGEKYIIEDEAYFTVTIEYNNSDKWEISSFNIINEAFTEMYEITYTVDGKSFRWTKRRNSLPHESTLKVPDLEYDGIELIPPVSAEQIGSGEKINYTCIGNTPIIYSALHDYREPRPDDVSLASAYDTIVIDSREELVEIIEALAPYSRLDDSGYEDIPSFNQISSYYNEEYFKNNSLILFPRPSTAKIIKAELDDMNISDDLFSAAVHYEVKNVEMTEGIGISDTWLITFEISKDEISNCEFFAIK